jgi:hypothetical protein
MKIIVEEGVKIVLPGGNFTMDPYLKEKRDNSSSCSKQYCFCIKARWRWCHSCRRFWRPEDITEGWNHNLYLIPVMKEQIQIPIIAAEVLLAVAEC